MESVVLSFFLLILKVSFKLAPDAINKNLGVLKVFLERSFKFWLCNWSGALVAALLLGPSETDSATKMVAANGV